MPTFPPTLPVKKLDVERAEYAEYKSAWSDIDLLAAGGVRLRAAASRFLVKRPKEAADVYAERCRRITQESLLGTVLGWYGAKMFRQEAEIDSKNNTRLTEFLEDCNRCGTRFVDAFQKVFDNCLRYGSSWILTDRPAVTVEPADREEEISFGLDQPFIAIYDPVCVPNWATDDYGNLEWAWIHAEEPPSLSPFEDSKLERYWYYFDKQQFAVYKWAGDPEKRTDKDNVAQLIDSGDHFLASENRVPMQRVCVPDILWLANRVYLLVIDHLNQENSYAWALFLANLPMPVIIGPWDDKSLTVSEMSLLHLPDPSSSIDWLEPRGVSFQHSADRLAYLREEFYRTVYLQAQGRSSAATPAMQSGYSKELDMAPANDVLNQFGDIIRHAQNMTLRDVCYSLGMKVPVAVNGYRFDAGSTMAEIEMAQGVSDVGINSETLTKYRDKRVALAYTDGESSELQDAIVAEIEANPTMAEKVAADMKAQMGAFETGAAEEDDEEDEDEEDEERVAA